MATQPLAHLLAESDAIVRALDAANEVVELMRITHGVLHRAHNETHGEAHEVVAKLSHSQDVDAEVLGGRSGHAVLIEARCDAGLTGGDVGQQSFARGNAGGCH